MSHTIITMDQYLGPYKDHPAARAVVLLDNAAQIISRMNEFCTEAEAAGVSMKDNPATGNAISGNGNGGARVADTAVGAVLSKHKDFAALDRFDPRRALMEWALTPDGVAAAERIGLWFEHPQWTRSWLHGQIVPPHSGNRFFVPYSDLAANPPTCAALPGQEAAGVPVFAFKAK